MRRDRADLVAQQNALIEGKVAYQVAAHVSDNEKAQMEWFKKLKLLLGRGLPSLSGHQVYDYTLSRLGLIGLHR
ncbi:hypothetical protein Tco_0591690 [Tanacetum coccineum]